MKRRITFDFETRSASNLRREGPFKYSRHPTTQPTCLALKEEGNPTVYFLAFDAINKKWKDLPAKLRDMWYGWILKGYEFSAHNATFERAVYNNILVARYDWPPIPLKQWRCTAAKAAACAIPRSLEGAGEAMELRVQKDKRGYNAMMATCKPTRAYNAWVRATEEIAAGKRVGPKKLKIAAGPVPKMFLEYADAPDVWETLYTYCKIDVRAEEQLDLSLPDLSPDEQDIWHLNQLLNWRGLRFDRPTVEKIVAIMAIESKLKIKELDQLTMGLVSKPGAIKSILEFLALDDIVLPNLRAKTVSDSLEGFALTEDGRRLLEIRKALSMSSTKKYQTFLDRGVGDRIRDILMYHGASTGRDTGTGVQPHNFPRGLIKVNKDRPYAAVENVIECDHETLQLLYGESLGVLFSALLRNMIIPDDGYELFVADFSKIEVAVLWWLADNESGLKILRDNLDPYKYQASANTGHPYETIRDDSDARQLGKAQILGCGFGMGWIKFQTTAWDFYRLSLTDEQSKKAVLAYREANAAVPELWKAYEQAAIAAIKTPKKKIVAGKCEFLVERDFLWVTLPSGRRLAYRKPQISWRIREYIVKTTKVVDGEEVEHFETKRTKPMETLEYWGLDKSKKKMQLERNWGGGLTENIVQAVARDLMMPALLRLEKRGYQALLAVHDEGICQAKIGRGNIEEFTKILCEVPKWAVGLPIEAKGWAGKRYRK